jgi:hypothetical protein
MHTYHLINDFELLQFKICEIIEIIENCSKLDFIFAT